MYVERRPWHWVDWALLGIFTSWLGMGLLFIGTEPGMGDLEERIWTMLAIILCYFTVFLVWRPGYTNKIGLPLLTLATAGTIEMVLTYRNGHEIVNAVTVLLLVVAFHSKGKLLILNSIVFLLVLPLVENQFLLVSPWEFAKLFNHIVNLASLFAIGYGIQRLWASNYGMRQLYEENLRQYQMIQEQNNTLEQYANQVEKLTLLEERNRLARELHDTVGHTFTSVIMGMDAVYYLLDTAPEKAKEKLEVLRQVTRSGLEEVRRSIHQIAPRDEEGTFLQQMTQLAQEFSLHTGTQVQIRSEGEECELPKQTQLTLIRCLQEALTNAKRHGQAGIVQVRLDFMQWQVLLQIKDNGIGTDRVEVGFGLTAMQERLSSLQGRLEVTSVPGEGTTLTCWIPISR